MSQPTLRPVVTAYRRALSSQFSFKILRMSFVPLLLSLVIGFTILYFAANPLMDVIQSIFSRYNLNDYTGASMFKMIVVPLILMVLLLPLTLVIVTLIMNVAAMPAIVKHVAARQYAGLEEKKGGTMTGGLWLNLVTMLKFVPIWLVTLPLYIFPPLAIAVQVILFGRLNARVMAYDALADHASAEEFAAIVKLHARDLTTIGVISGACGAIPGLVWLGGAITLMFPVLAPLSIWLFIMVFIFTALWFQYYCMQALEELRAARRGKDAVAVHD
ncbi:EI24 domain-containing protein [Massilia sp. TSP1-1-2]|uniref:EI24 domain-containing protein n=1 Tax=unclassified Massilia TaxID=2609279 RepID=UPI003CF43680